jgi:hypothetical protein
VLLQVWAELLVLLAEGEMESTKHTLINGCVHCMCVCYCCCRCG